MKICPVAAAVLLGCTQCPSDARGASEDASPDAGSQADSSPYRCASDLTGDGIIDTLDLVVVLSNFGAEVEPGQFGDLTLDGSVNTLDLILIIQNFGVVCF